VEQGLHVEQGLYVEQGAAVVGHFGNPGNVGAAGVHRVVGAKPIAAPENKSVPFASLEVYHRGTMVNSHAMVHSALEE